MSLIGMSKETYLKILDEVDEIHYLIIQNYLTYYPTVEEILMKRHNLNSDDVRSFLQLSRQISDFPFRYSSPKSKWIADRPAPKLEDYPEVAELLSK